ncbi:hypothetical protein NB037_03090 [Rathayibacter sp. ZW T2_19]|uniref:DUF7426 domain-containing protein n=1 Tax=Rathayibacter rubneri TaxID=2950106 RepID=A0A9X2DVQ8_9MICO|nr:hypothetical protein [Rathayibacter rubneri]MCM6761393.1 hypothetical protein [Rathayibacter rubneri]
MTTVDFGAWARGLTLTLGSVTYTVPEPSVADMRQVLALAVRAEVGRDNVPAEILEILENLPDDGHPALGTAYDELVRDGVGSHTLDRMGVYATLFWARGREYADSVAEKVWGPEREAAAAQAKDAARPKARRTGRQPTGQPSASESPTTSTSTASRSTRSTARSRAKPSK